MASVRKRRWTYKGEARETWVVNYTDHGGSRRQRRVFDVIAELHGEGRRPCDADIAARLGWSICRITGRRNELVATGRVNRSGDKIAETGRKVSCWRPAPRQLELFRAAACWFERWPCRESWRRLREAYSRWRVTWLAEHGDGAP